MALLSSLFVLTLFLFPRPLEQPPRSVEELHTQTSYMMLGFLFWLLPTLSCFTKPTNGLQITMEDMILLNVATTVSYVTESTDPSNWLLRNVYANGTTQIGGVQSGTGTASFTFQSPGPHFLQAVA
ncbi:hypothetical protein F5890DRAFT_885476 [Lentinula detonsa]|uniref:Uncharacterized protein n=1 Tax=Lentinula detonsa TaxID=2804962 RepID=A0AA38Q516_9AGAR|nr:hypothetical protein F5890DRAFT_885476 [Lentinula detonsa]